MYILISGLYLTALSCFDTIQKLGMLKCFPHLFCVNNITQNLFHGYLWVSLKKNCVFSRLINTRTLPEYVYVQLWVFFNTEKKPQHIQY